MNQEIIVLVGLPGSGKTSLTKEYPEHIRISQDVLGSRVRCIDACREALSSGKSVIIDRTNIDVKQRSHWIKLGKEYNVSILRAIYLEADPEECIKRIHLRKGHETIKEDLDLQTKANIVNRFNYSLKLPTLHEGFTETFLKKT